jgi:hypothetical protein
MFWDFYVVVENKRSICFDWNLYLYFSLKNIPEINKQILIDLNFSVYYLFSFLVVIHSIILSLKYKYTIFCMVKHSLNDWYMRWDDFEVKIKIFLFSVLLIFVVYVYLLLVYIGRCCWFIFPL